MPTIFTHAVLPVIVGRAVKPGALPGRLICAGALASVLPDFDVIGFRVGIPYGAELGHRGASHSLLFAMVCGALAMGFARRLKSPPKLAFAFVAFTAASHGLTDMLTNGGRGVALWWPFSDERLFWPVRPVEVSSIGMRAMTDGSLLDVLASEFIWLIMPTAIVAILFRMLVAPHIDLARGQS